MEVLGEVKVLERLCGKAGANCAVGLKRQDELCTLERGKSHERHTKKVQDVRKTVKGRTVKSEEDCEAQTMVVVQH